MKMIFRRMTAAVIQRVMAFVMNRKPARGQVLMFHQVCDDKSRWKADDCAITRQGFHKLIDTLMAEGTVFGKIEELFQTQDAQVNKVWITFDDAYADVYTNAFPVLKTYGIPFTVFLTVDFLDKEMYLKTEHVLEMMNSGLCTVGSHTVSHRMLSGLCADEGCVEIEESKKRLEDIFRIPVDSIAFPFGSVYACRKRHRRNAQDAGYKVAFSSVNSTLPVGAGVFFLPRINVNEDNYQQIKSR